MVESKIGQDVEVFEAMMQSKYSLNTQVKTHMKTNLATQTAMIAEAQLEQITAFNKEFLKEAKAANAAVEALREKISSAHNDESGKSFLK